MIARALAEVGASPIMQGYHDHWRAAAEVLVSAWRARGRRRDLLRAAIGHAVVFPTWRSLVRDQGLSDSRAVDLMYRLTCDCDG